MQLVQTVEPRVQHDRSRLLPPVSAVITAAIGVMLVTAAAVIIWRYVHPFAGMQWVNEGLSACEVIVANGLVITSALTICRLFQVDGRVHYATAVVLWYLTQIQLTMLIAGVILQRLEPDVVIALNLMIALVALLVARRMGKLAVPVSKHLPQRALTVLRQTLSDPLTAALAAIGGVELLWSAVVVAILPPYDYDGLNYHLLSGVAWMQVGRIIETPYIWWTNIYPQNIETFYGWLMLFPQSLALVRLGQGIFLLGGMLALAGLGRLLGLGRPASALAALLFALTPITLAQVTTDYIDVAVASLCLMSLYFLVRYVQAFQPADLLLAGIGAGLAAGSKGPALLFLAAVGATVFAAQVWRRQQLRRELVRLLLLFAVPAFICGAYWYLRSWHYFGSPTWPFGLKLLGHQVIAGIDPETTIVAQALPPQLATFPQWQRPFISWTSEPPLENIYRYDSYSGFGFQWLYLEAPAIVVMLIDSIRRRAASFLLLLLPIVVAFQFQPGNWESRYTLLVVGPGALALAAVLQSMQGHWTVSYVLRNLVRVICLGFVLLGAVLSSHHGAYEFDWQWQNQLLVNGRTPLLRALSLPQEQRTIGNLYQPAYQWTDSLPAGSVVAGTDYSATRMTILPIMGPHFQSTYVVFRTSSYDVFLSTVESNHIGYIFADSGEVADAWGAADPVHFHLVDRTQSWVDPHQYTVVYRIDLSAAPLLDHFYSAVLSSAHLPSTMSAGATYSTTLHIQSAAQQAWPAGAVRVGYRWYAKDPTVVAGLVAPPPIQATVLPPLPATVDPGAALDVPVSFVAPTQPGTYTLRIDLVYERTHWFADYGNIALSVPVTVTAKG